MSQSSSKIVGLMIFIIVVSVLFFVALMPAKKHGSARIKSLAISGNHLLSENSYLNFAKLSNVQNSVEISLPVVKDRLEKHPFIASTEVEISKYGSAIVQMYEKELIAILIIDDESFLLSAELQLLPVFYNTKFVDLPIINNPKYGRKYRVLNYLNSEEIIEAYNIVSVIKNLNEEMLKKLSEINLNNGNDISLTFSGIHPLIKFGRNSIPKKILTLNSIWNEIKNNDNELSRSEYVDLRFKNQIYLGKVAETEL